MKYLLIGMLSVLLLGCQSEPQFEIQEPETIVVDRYFVLENNLDEPFIQSFPSNQAPGFSNECPNPTTITMNVGYLTLGYSFLETIFYLNNWPRLDINHPVYGCFGLSFAGVADHPTLENRFYIVYQVEVEGTLSHFNNSQIGVYWPSNQSCSCRGTGNLSLEIDCCLDVYASLNCNEYVIQTPRYTGGQQVYCL